MSESNLGDSQIFIINALRILGTTGGYILCTPGKNRMWKIRNAEVSVSGVNLSRACTTFVEDVTNPEKLT